MKAVAVTIVAIAITTSPVFACNETEIQSWKNACDRVAGFRNKCNNLRCFQALRQLVKRETRDCYVYLGMGKSTDLAKYINLVEACNYEDFMLSLFEIPN